MNRSPNRMRGFAVAVVCASTLAVSAGSLVTTAGAAPAAPAATICPAAAGNARFVRQIFLQILSRCPDGKAAPYWTQRLNNGLSRYAFAEAVDTSAENLVKNNAIPIYEGILGRAPTTTEIKAVAAHIIAEHEDGKINATLVSLDEFYNKIPGATPAAKDQAWLTQAYMGIVDRAPDGAGRTFFTGVLHANSATSTVASRYRVAELLERSLENAQGWTGAVFGAGLNRAPDRAGFAYWVNWLTGVGKWQTFRLWTHILSSNEGYALAQTQPNPQQPSAAKRSRSGLGAYNLGR